MSGIPELGKCGDPDSTFATAGGGPLNHVRLQVAYNVGFHMSVGESVLGTARSYVRLESGFHRRGACGGTIRNDIRVRLLRGRLRWRLLMNLLSRHCEPCERSNQQGEAI